MSSTKDFFLSSTTPNFSEDNIAKFWEIVRPNLANVLQILESRESWVNRSQFSESEIEFFSDSFKKGWANVDQKELAELMLPFLGGLPISLCLFFLGWLEVHGELSDEGLSFVECCSKIALELIDEKKPKDYVTDGAEIFVQRLKTLSRTKALYTVLHKTANLKQIKQVL